MLFYVYKLNIFDVLFFSHLNIINRSLFIKLLYGNRTTVNLKSEHRSPIYLKSLTLLSLGMSKTRRIQAQKFCARKNPLIPEAPPNAQLHSWIPPPIGFLSIASMANKTADAIFAIVAIILLLSSNIANASNNKEPPNAKKDKTIFQSIRDFFFPTIEITIFNDGADSVYYMCKFTKNDTGLHELRPREKFIYNFTQIAFPMRWCYLYINDKMNGFFWSYSVRLRCTKCFWSISNYPHLYRSDRGRWERQQLFNPLDFNISRYRKT